jgi:hypothetical protein
MPSVRMLARVRALESLTMDSTWLVLECDTIPTDTQVQQMEEARAEGRISILFLERHSTIWLPGFDKPWKTG